MLLNSKGCIDEPTNLEEVGRFIRVKGWAITAKSQKVELNVDDMFLGEIHLFIDREDVKESFPHIKNSGFDQVFLMPELSEGWHKLLLKSTNHNSMQVVYARKIKYNSRVDYTPKTIGIETSRICNFQCDMCPAHSERGRYTKKDLIADDALLDRVIPFLKSSKWPIKRVGAGAIWGEPLMNRKYFENTERIANACPGAQVVITTNGAFLNSLSIEKILDSDYIRHVAVSVDAGTKETYELIRKGGKWDILMENLSRLVRAKKNRKLKRPLISSNFVAMKKNFEELPLYVKEMANIRVDAIGVVNAHNVYSSDIDQGIFDLPGKVNDVAKEREKVIKEAISINLPKGVSLYLPSFTPEKRYPECSLNGASTILIGIEGQVYPCCVIQSLHYEGNTEAKSMGNVFKEELEDIWSSDEFVHFRAKMLRGKAPSPICLNCPFFYGM